MVFTSLREKLSRIILWEKLSAIKIIRASKSIINKFAFRVNFWVNSYKPFSKQIVRHQSIWLIGTYRNESKRFETCREISKHIEA